MEADRKKEGENTTKHETYGTQLSYPTYILLLLQKEGRTQNTRNSWRHNGQKYYQTVENINPQIQETQQTSS